MAQVLEAVHLNYLNEVVLKVQVTCVGGDAIRDITQAPACADYLAELIAARTDRRACLGTD